MVRERLDLTGPNPDTAPFPPTDIHAFLRCCEGSWMSLRSRFDLEAAAQGQAESGEQATTAESTAEAAEPNEAWHQSERGELEIRYLAAANDEEPGSLHSQPAGANATTLEFLGDGRFQSSAGDGGTWKLWPDGSLELSLEPEGRRIRERIWFTKPNLRLRSTVEHFSDGSAGRASFSSEIRRVSRPAAS